MDNVLASASGLPIDADLPCSGCNYNLKGLTADANCPECGQPMSRTLRFGLVYSDPAWLRRQAAVVPWLAALCLPSFRGELMSYPIATYTGQVFNLAAVVVALFACWRLAAADPASTMVDEHGSIRRGLRLAALLLVVLNVAALPVFGRAPVANFARTPVFLNFARPVVLAATDLLAMLLLARLAHRSGSRSLRAHARAVLYIFPVMPLGILLAYAAYLTGVLEPYIDLTMALYRTLDALGTVALCAMLILLGRLHETLRAAAAVGATVASAETLI
jgi:hypothetical protein